MIIELRKTGRYQLKELLETAKIAKSVFKYWNDRLPEQHDKEAEIVESIQTIVAESKGRYGYRRVCLALKNKGMIVNHKKVLRLMRKYQLLCGKFKHRNRQYKAYKGKVGKIAKNKLSRRFKTDRPYQKVLTDITQFNIPASGEKLYLSPFMDAFSGEILSCKINRSPTLDIAIDPLIDLIQQRPMLDYRMTVHSDQGWHYQHRQWVKYLKKHQTFQSMSRKGNCLDNSPMENFFGLLKQEMFYGQQFTTYTELESAIHQYIAFYNNDRIKTKLKGMSPVNYRRHTFNKIA
ncbi:Integrase core domain protein [Jeotgalicoccus saudimassiliensis]|uniref:Integrase core domain protein n=1 Tax=Jeotgalicoccus saudimassiliensis TaxID=1461582 RepID=A0A078MBA0_9STAP|nr:IS3 family transposase [Jeotgalicoccus saudimassiliensis]CEA01981.1 Integrase core domain protein [Jeotgalicoccus saudimassiliensis]